MSTDVHYTELFSSLKKSLICFSPVKIFKVSVHKRACKAADWQSVLQGVRVRCSAQQMSEVLAILKK